MIGKILGNRYEILEKIGGGGMALVYRAKCRLLNRFVAVKILRPEFTSDEEFIGKFKRESQAAASLSHPNIVNIYDVGNDENDIYYIVMEYVKGRTLKQIIKEKGSIEPNDAINMAKQIALALEHAHNNHIVHRDIKPHNILITEDSRVKVTDFGIARAVTSSTVTNTGNVIGSVHYFSPEQARGGYTDEKSDLYSLGIVLYEMVTGRVPFEGESPISIALKHIHEDIKLPSLIKKDVPKALEDVILKATQKDQTKRYASSREMLEDLNQALKFPTDSFVRFEEDDDSPTQIIPAINEEDIRKKTASLENSNKKKNAKLIFWSAIILAFILALTVTGAIYVYNYQFKGQEKEVPSVIGNTVEEAKTNIENLGLKFEISSEQYNSQYEEGYVISQIPSAQEIVKEGYIVKLIVSKGAQLVKVPTLTNKKLEDIDLFLENSSLNTGNIDYEYSTLPIGIVISQSPEPGVKVPRDSEVNVVVSQGQEMKVVLMPNVVGEEIEKAKNTIETSGLVVGNIDYKPHKSIEKDRILTQNIDPGSEVQEKTTINLTVSEGPEGIEQPSEEDELQMKSVSFSLYYDDAKQEEFILKIIKIQNGVATDYYSGVHQKSKGSQKTTIKGRGKATIEIYFDNVLIERKQIDFETGAIYD